jgi:nucleoid DNA-binding protein
MIKNKELLRSFYTERPKPLQGITKHQSEEICENLFDFVGYVMENSNCLAGVYLRGFGRFYVNDKMIRRMFSTLERNLISEEDRKRTLDFLRANKKMKNGKKDNRRKHDCFPSGEF